MAQAAIANDPPGSPAADPAILLIHGHRQIRGGMQRFAHALRSDGHDAFGFRYDSMVHGLSRIVDDLERAARQTAGRTDGPMHFIGHSLGGLLIRALLARWRPPQLGRVVMMGTPHGGSEWADLSIRWGLGKRVLGPVADFLVTGRTPANEALLCPIDFPLGVIAGRTRFEPIIPVVLPRPNDGTVSVASTRIAGMAEHLVMPVTHAMMPSNAAVRAQAMHFLRCGRFDRG